MYGESSPLLCSYGYNSFLLTYLIILYIGKHLNLNLEDISVSLIIIEYKANASAPKQLDK